MEAEGESCLLFADELVLLLDSYWTEPDELMRLLCESYGVSADENSDDVEV